MVAMLRLLSCTRSYISETEVSREALIGELISLLSVLRAENLITLLCSLVKNNNNTYTAYVTSLLSKWFNWHNAQHASRLTISLALCILRLITSNNTYSVSLSKLVAVVSQSTNTSFANLMSWRVARLSSFSLESCCNTLVNPT